MVGARAHLKFHIDVVPDQIADRHLEHCRQLLHYLDRRVLGRAAKNFIQRAHRDSGALRDLPDRQLIPLFQIIQLPDDLHAFIPYLNRIW